MLALKHQSFNAKKVTWVALAILAVLLPDLALASPSGGGLPWDDPLQTLADSFTGPVAYVVSVLALFASFAGLAFGGEINDTTRRVFLVALIISGLVFITQLLTSLFGVSGAVI